MKTDGAAIMLQFECAKCENFRDLWSSSSIELTDIEKEKVANEDMQASTQGRRTRQVNHDVYTAVIWVYVGTNALENFLEGVGSPHGRENQSYAAATKLVRCVEKYCTCLIPATAQALPKGGGLVSHLPAWCVQQRQSGTVVATRLVVEPFQTERLVLGHSQAGELHHSNLESVSIPALAIATQAGGIHMHTGWRGVVHVFQAGAVVHIHTRLAGLCTCKAT